MLSWIAPGLLIGFFLLCAAANAQILVQGARAKPGERVPSFVPFVGGLVGALGVYLAPLPAIKGYFWVPLLLDVGCLGGFVVGLLALVPKLFAAETPPARERFEKEDAIVGCILGTAVGDALGLACEGLSRQRQARMFPDLSRYHFLPGRGMTSDDTEHTLMLAQSLIETGGYHASLRAKRFTGNFAWRLRFWLLGLPAGVGLATGRAILKLWIGFPGKYSGINSAGNGAAMRVALIGVCYGEDREKMLDLVRAATRITHTDPRAEAGSQAVALAAHLSASGTPERFLEQARSIPGLSELVEGVCASVASGETSEAFAARIGCADGVTGFVNHTVPAALHVWLRDPRDYRAAVTGMIRLGGDSDTTAAIVGAIVGAGVGKQGIPAEWLTHLWEWPRTTAWMEAVGLRLAECAAKDQITGAVPVNPLKLLLRNAVFLVIVLLHGFRRLLPPY